MGSNDNWRDSNEADELQRIGLDPKDDRSSAFITSLIPGPYTAIVRGKEATTGVALVELYDLTN